MLSKHSCGRYLHCCMRHAGHFQYKLQTELPTLEKTTSFQTSLTPASEKKKIMHAIPSPTLYLLKNSLKSFGRPHRNDYIARGDVYFAAGSSMTKVKTRTFMQSATRLSTL